jgi:bacillopeptidase F (M6 metalloprotease family)
LLWTSVTDPPGRAVGDAALYSGIGNNRDELAVRSIAVPAGSPSLTFDAFWNEELGWDFGFIQISTDNGVTYNSVACTDTTTVTDPDALPTAKGNVPGFTGFSGTWKPESCSLAAYAGKTVLLALRTYNDPAALGDSSTAPPGFWVDNVKLGATLISDGSDIASWKSMTQVRPTTVAGYNVTLISVRGTGSRAKVTVRALKLDSGFQSRNRGDVDRYIDDEADWVGAVVTFDDPTETVDQYAPYTLTVNGVVQPGGN